MPIDIMGSPERADRCEPIYLEDKTVKYMGSKARIANDILGVILCHNKNKKYYIEPFCGGCNVIDKVPDQYFKIASDNNIYLIFMLEALKRGWIPPRWVSKEQYYEYKNGNCPNYIRGWVGINCSYSGKWFGGFAGRVRTKINTIRDYQDEAWRHVLRQAPKLKNVHFVAGDYRAINIPQGSIVYCDPPYHDTTKYKSNFQHDEFWEWCRRMSLKDDVDLFVSEYYAPQDFVCVWEQKLGSSLSANGKYGGRKESTERLWKWKH